MESFSEETIRKIVLIFGSMLASFVMAMLIAPFFIKSLYKYGIGQQIRENAVDGKAASLFRKLHIGKKGTPTMGGVLIWGVVVAVVVLSMLLEALGYTKFSLWNRAETYLPVFTLITVAILGAVDDIFNIKNIGGAKGIKVKPKMFWLILFGVIGALWFYFKLDWDMRPISIPYVGLRDIGFWVVPLFILVIISSANAVNITDGLDGLAGGLLVIAFISFGVIAYAQGLFILSAFCAVVAGAIMAFLWFNVPPARFYMGDTGSLSLGATLGVIAMLTNSVFILPIIGFVFVIETLSSLIQIFSKKFFNRKVFHIAPFHHHLEYIGWAETKITLRLWIVGGLVAMFGIILRLIS
ncbi:phospho-N-acetylmuramoyl-pentapeptide-transferase [Patescibacteria group bacterium]|nr:phospho-N-acetylmuramoyl-pentapeptide-transferase [Patescibacteria group bacterium]